MKVLWRQVRDRSEGTVVLCRRALEACLAAIEENRLTLKLPAKGSQPNSGKKAHSHTQPELFLQVSGVTDFAMPKQMLRLGPKEVLLVPPNTPHDETVKGQRSPFCNLVLAYRPDLFSFHFALESTRSPGRPRGLGSETYRVPQASRLLGHLAEIEELSHYKSVNAAKASRALFLSHLAGLLLVLENEEPVKDIDHPKIELSKKLLASNLYAHSLDVPSLAEWVGRSPDYLSHLFHKETGEHLVSYINRERMLHARELLAKSTLNVSEISWSCGYNDPAYFSRLFRKATKQTPKQYRASVAHARDNTVAAPSLKMEKKP